MEINIREQWRLRRLERELHRTEPHLAGMLAVFGRLTAQDVMPAVERLRRPGRVVRLATLLAAVLTSLAVAAGRLAAWAARPAARLAGLLCAWARRLVARTRRTAPSRPAGARPGLQTTTDPW